MIRLNLLTLGWLALAGCGDERSRVPIGDAIPGADANDAADAATEVGTDAGADAATDAATDGGGADAPPMCTDSPIPPWTRGRVCPPSMKTCVDACTDSGCVDACLDDGDPTSECSFCQQVQLISCINRNGCDPFWDCFSSCVSSNCPGVRDDACVDANCGGERVAFEECSTGEGVLSLCGTRYLDCLPE